MAHDLWDQHDLAIVLRLHDRLVGPSRKDRLLPFLAGDPPMIFTTSKGVADLTRIMDSPKGEGYVNEYAGAASERG